MVVFICAAASLWKCRCPVTTWWSVTVDVDMMEVLSLRTLPAFLHVATTSTINLDWTNDRASLCQWRTCLTRYTAALVMPCICYTSNFNAVQRKLCFYCWFLPLAMFTFCSNNSRTDTADTKWFTLMLLLSFTLMLTHWSTCLLHVWSVRLVKWWHSRWSECWQDIASLMYPLVHSTVAFLLSRVTSTLWALTPMRSLAVGRLGRRLHQSVWNCFTKDMQL